MTLDLRPDGAVNLYACGWACDRIGDVSGVPADVVRLWLRARSVELRPDDAHAMAERRPLHTRRAADRRRATP